MPGLLANLFTKRWTLSDLMNIDSSRQQKSTGCSVSVIDTYVEIVSESILDKFKKFFTRNKSLMNAMFVIFKFNVISETGHSYEVFIRTQYDPYSNLFMKNVAQVYCGCPDFKFKSAWKLNQHASLFRSDRVDINLGPAITNAPKKQSSITLCKHSYAAIMYLINNYNSLMRYV